MPTPVSMHIFIVDVSLKAYKPCHDIEFLHTKPFMKIIHLYTYIVKTIKIADLFCASQQTQDFLSPCNLTSHSRLGVRQL